MRRLPLSNKLAISELCDSPMALRCDHTSVGILVWRQGRLLLIERRKPPFGYAPPSGHVDERPTYLAAAVAELCEEVGLRATSMELLAEGRRNNPCRRLDGNWHFWRIYRAEAFGDPVANQDEVMRIVWCDVVELRHLAARTRAFQKKLITQLEWEASPGLEPVWLDWLQQLGSLDT